LGPDATMVSKAGRSNPPRRMRSSISAATSHSAARTYPADDLPGDGAEKGAGAAKGLQLGGVLANPGRLDQPLGRDEAPAPARRDGVSRRDSVNASCRLTVRCADSNPTRGQSNPLRKRGERGVVRGIDLEEPQARAAGRDAGLDLGHVAPVGDEHELVLRQDRDGAAPGEPGQVADVGQVEHDEGVEALAAERLAHARVPGGQQDRGWLCHR